MSTAARPLTLWVPELQLRRIAEEAEDYRPQETGGILLGHRSGIDVVVREIAGAGPGAVRTTTGMRPDHEYQVRAVRQAFTASHGAVTYLGDWHSHPEGSGELSPRDRRTLRNIAFERDAFCPEPVLLILASRGSGVWVPVAWSGRLGRMGRWGGITVSRSRLRPYAAPPRRPHD
jgi:integrative and conjugative element protein (TIGR02256 family)